jgi:hypothetical protein
MSRVDCSEKTLGSSLKLADPMGSCLPTNDRSKHVNSRCLVVSTVISNVSSLPG